jgi:hypothetical protein
LGRADRQAQFAGHHHARSGEGSALFAKTGAALSPAIAPTQELIAVMIVVARRLNIRRNLRSAACLVLSVQGGTEQSLNNSLPNTR